MKTSKNILCHVIKRQATGSLEFVEFIFQTLVDGDGSLIVTDASSVSTAHPSQGTDVTTPQSTASPGSTPTGGTNMPTEQATDHVTGLPTNLPTDGGLATDGATAGQTATDGFSILPTDGGVTIQ